MKIMKVIMAAILCMALLMPLTATALAESSHIHYFPASNTDGTVVIAYIDYSTTQHKVVVHHLRFCDICGEEGLVEISSVLDTHKYTYHQNLGHGPAPNTHAYTERCICTRTVARTYTCSGNPCILPV